MRAIAVAAGLMGAALAQGASAQTFQAQASMLHGYWSCKLNAKTAPGIELWMNSTYDPAGTVKGLIRANTTQNNTRIDLDVSIGGTWQVAANVLTLNLSAAELTAVSINSQPLTGERFAQMKQGVDVSQLTTMAGQSTIDELTATSLRMSEADGSGAVCTR